MTRVSENSSTASVNHAISQAKSKLEDLQIKGSTLKKLSKPSDNPIGNIEALTIGSVNKDNEQYLRNASFALSNLNITERAVESLTEILNKAKEIALAQSSDFYDSNIRKNVSNEIVQLRNQTLAIANKRVGNKYIFAGHATLTPPFKNDGKYVGDTGKIHLEIEKDFFVPINLTGEELFLSSNLSKDRQENPLDNKQTASEGRSLASVETSSFTDQENIFSLLDNLTAGLENNDSKLIQGLLEKFDSAITRLVTLRTKIGSISNSIQAAQNTVESEVVDNTERKSKIVDADLAELFSDITKQQNVLQTSYKASQGLMNKTLLDFLR